MIEHARGSIQLHIQSREINLNETCFMAPTYILNACERNWYQITTDFNFNIAIFQQGQNNLF